MQFARPFRLLALTAAIAAGVLLAAVAQAPAATYKLKPIATHRGIYTFRVAKLRSRRVAKAELRAGRAKRRISVNRLRRATRHHHGIMRVHAPRPIGAIDARRGGKHVTLVVSTTPSTSTTTTTTQTT